MDTRTFLENFGTIADAPGGVQRLRDLILDIAVRGMLVEQFPDEESPSTDDDTGVNPESVWPFDVPTRWRWVQMGQITDSRLGKMLDKAKNKGPLRPYLRNANVQWFRFDLSDIHELRLEDEDLDSHTVRQGDLVICEGGEPGRLAICDESIAGMVIQKALHRVRPLAGVDPWYLAYAIRGYAATGFLASFFTGATIKHLTGKALASVPIPLPPLAEQERIVAKVDELMGLCDDLEARQQHRHRVTTSLRTSALHALTEAETPDDLRHAWNRLSSNWPAITASAEAIGELRQTILQLAVTGRLTTSLPHDGTATDLLGASAALDDPALVDSEGAAVADPYTLPPSWTWVTLGSVLTKVLAGWSAPSTQQRRNSDEWAVLKVSACTWGVFRPEENKALKPGAVPREALEVRAGDLLITRANTSDLVARSVVVDTTPPRLMLSDKTLRLTPIKGCNPRYLNLANLAPAARAHYQDEATGTSDSMKNVSQRAIRRTPIPLPPSPEQDRIVANVDELLGLCDDLEAQLSTARTVQESLTEAATAHLTVET